MIDSMTDHGAMMWGMGIAGFLVLALLILGIAALLKYLFRDRRGNASDG